MWQFDLPAHASERRRGESKADPPSNDLDYHMGHDFRDQIIVFTHFSSPPFVEINDLSCLLPIHFRVVLIRVFPTTVFPTTVFPARVFPGLGLLKPAFKRRAMI
jgi:hypothetical protein